MKIDTLSYNDNQWELNSSNIGDTSKASIVFLFGDSDILKSKQCLMILRKNTPKLTL